MTIIVTFTIVGFVIMALLAMTAARRGQLGRRTAKVCSRCRRVNGLEARFCGHCGQRLT
ncbi:MAG: zinc ribbon domain-containing protein [bacterium]|nr:zinc ribbon domain-containing protein [bacterium]